MAWISVYFGLGSNEGDRLRNIREAVRLLDEALGVPCSALSRIIETEAWGFSGRRFLNACVRYRILRKGTPEEQGHELLRICKETELRLGRREVIEYNKDNERVYHDRPIDIDILFYGKERIESPDLSVPHPQIGERAFVLEPLRQIATPALRKAFPAYFENLS